MSTDREIIPQPSIAIAGGGLIGLSVAWRLAQHKFRVTVFERTKVGSEASWAGAGMLALGGEFDSPTPCTTLALESRRMYAAFVRELEAAAGTSIDFQECGGLDLAYNSQEWVELRDRAERQRNLGIDSKLLGAAQVKTLWPRVCLTNLAGAIFYPGDAVVNPRELVAALTSTCRQLGVEIVEQAPVVRIGVKQDGVAVETHGTAEGFDAAVIAAGAWSSSIILEGDAPLPASEPVKGHLIGFQQPEYVCNTIIRHGHYYLLQRANGLLIAGASVEHVGWDPSIQAGIVSSLAEEAGRLLPHLRGIQPSEIWVGFRPASDALHLGAWHSRRIYLAYGHYRNGILLAPATAEKIEVEISANLRKH